jgi:hypothetical protein
MIFIYKMASGVRMSKNWIPRLRFLFLSFSQYVADYSDPRSRPFQGNLFRKFSVYQQLRQLSLSPWLLMQAGVTSGA